MMRLLTFLLMVHVSHAETQTGSCKDTLHGILSGLGEYQIGALKEEFQRFTNNMERSMNVFKKQMRADFERKGYTGGSHYTHSGAAVEPLCLPRDPEWGRYKAGADGYQAYVYGAEYETRYSMTYLRSLNNHDVPCAVCLFHNRSILKVFPARKTCYKGWILEYNGYLMAGLSSHPAATTYKCVDRNPDSVTGGHSNHDGYLFYSVEARCGSLKCPPYVNGRELACAVCSKA